MPLATIVYVWGACAGVTFYQQPFSIKENIVLGNLYVHISPLLGGNRSLATKFNYFIVFGR